MRSIVTSLQSFTANTCPPLFVADSIPCGESSIIIHSFGSDGALTEIYTLKNYPITPSSNNLDASMDTFRD